MRQDFYNEIEPVASAWLLELMRVGAIRPGLVNTTPIERLTVDHVRGYQQAHFFAGIAGWPEALRLAGWPDDVPVWTGSCPCQPFSPAGKGLSFDDDRHLAPFWLRLIEECAPPVLFGEQVADGDGWAWMSLVRDALEGMGYAVGIACLGAPSASAPHQRHRNFFGAVRLGDADGEGWKPWKPALERMGHGQAAFADGGHGGLADPSEGQRGRRSDDAHNHDHGPQGRRDQGAGDLDRRGGGGDMANPGRLGGEHPERHDVAGAPGLDGGEAGEQRVRPLDRSGRPPSELAEAVPDALRRPAAGEPHLRLVWDALWERNQSQAWTKGYGDPSEVPAWAYEDHRGWDAADWLWCTDERWRPVEPGTFPLAHGIQGRVGLLRGYGNAIVPQVAATFIQSFIAACLEEESNV